MPARPLNVGPYPAMPPMSDNILMGLIAASGFFVIGCLSWFFSSRRKFFIRTFVPPDELRKALRSIPRDKSFGQGLRFIALLQMAVGVLFALIALGAWLVW